MLQTLKTLKTPSSFSIPLESIHWQTQCGERGQDGSKSKALSQETWLTLCLVMHPQLSVLNKPRWCVCMSASIPVRHYDWFYWHGELWLHYRLVSSTSVSSTYDHDVNEGWNAFETWLVILRKRMIYSNDTVGSICNFAHDGFTLTTDNKRNRWLYEFKEWAQG